LKKFLQFAQNFRNEGVDFSHNPEFTMIEIYQAYADYNDMMKLIEECWEFCAKKVLGTTKVKRLIDGKEYTIDFKAPWPRLTTVRAIKEYAGIDADKMNAEELKKFCKDKKISDCPENGCWGEYLDLIYEEFVEKNLIQPTHVIDRPKEGTPLCKRHREDERLNEQCEPVGLGMELGNMYTELNDPELQETLLKEQEEKGRGGDEEAHPMDEDFINALKMGMPPTGGIGWGIDRMAILFTGVESIRDIIFIPDNETE
jgi:lysyl-tRNA synthetase class 2